MNNILLTGGAGYIGSHISELLSQKKSNRVFILDNLSTGHKILIDKKSNFFKGDINDRKLINKIINKYHIETIIHLAATLNVSEAEYSCEKMYLSKFSVSERLLYLPI